MANRFDTQYLPPDYGIGGEFEKVFAEIVRTRGHAAADRFKREYRQMVKQAAQNMTRNEGVINFKWEMDPEQEDKEMSKATRTMNDESGIDILQIEKLGDELIKGDE